MRCRMQNHIDAYECYDKWFAGGGRDNSIIYQFSWKQTRERFYKNGLIVPIFRESIVL